MKSTLLRSSLVALLCASTFAALTPAQAQIQTVRVRRAGPQVDAGLPQGSLQLITPIDGSVVGSPTVDVRGLLAAPFDQPGTTVSVNGQAATVTAAGRGRQRFLLSNLELASGLNGLVIEASSPQGAVQRFDAAVTFSPLTGNNVVIRGGLAYLARGTTGLGIMDLRTRVATTMPPPAGSNRVDDVAIADGLLFLLDAASGGRLAVMDLSDPLAPALVSAPVNVPVGPFAGVSAGGGQVAVSGGTGLMTVRTYDGEGRLSAAVRSIDLGIGQPDVTVSEDGALAFVSTDFAGTVGGSSFGLTTVRLGTPLTIEQRSGLPGAGFTPGFQSPANFPIASARFQDGAVVAHGGGVSLVDAFGATVGTLPLGFPGVHVG
ncbi:MAG: hypothetical protein AAGG01_18525, partial [Planctomycetota bacterium]